MSRRQPTFRTELPSFASALVHAAQHSGEDPAAALRLARESGRSFPLPGGGSTLLRWAALAELARVNLTVARVVEAHTDALAILAEAGAEIDDRAWGVFAAEAPDTRLDATSDQDGSTTLTGVKPWCSLAGHLDAALVTARVGPKRALFAVDLRDPSVRVAPAEGWVARGLRTVTSGPVHFERTPAEPVGDVGWYLRRPGFAWGGIGVAACWHGGAQGLADTMLRSSESRTGELNSLHLGIVDVALHASACALAHAAERVDAADAQPEQLALRTRAVVSDSAERVIHQAGHALGPGPLAFDADHAARVADLTLYVRQHHGERDQAALGSLLLQPSQS